MCTQTDRGAEVDGDSSPKGDLEGAGTGTNKGLQSRLVRDIGA
jgi:hypothetical protein